MTDADFLLAVLSELPGEWVYQYVILQRSQMERGCGMTVHSRAADLRKRGLTVDCKVETSVDGSRRVSAYRLVLSDNKRRSREPNGPESPLVVRQGAPSQLALEGWAA